MPAKPIINVPRQLSQRSVFEALLHRSPISRADLAKVTGLSKQTTSEVIDAFQQQGLVHPIGRTSGSVGRTAVLYELSREGGHVLGIDLGARRLTVALADIAGSVLAEAAWAEAAWSEAAWAEAAWAENLGNGAAGE